MRLKFVATLQNSYDELWAVLDYVVPGCLGGRKEFMDVYAKPLKRARQLSASDYVVGQVLTGCRKSGSPLSRICTLTFVCPSKPTMSSLGSQQNEMSSTLNHQR